MNVVYERGIDAIMEGLKVPHISAARLKTSTHSYSMTKASYEVVSVLDDFMDVMQWLSITIITSTHHDLTEFMIKALELRVQIEYIYRIRDAGDITNITQKMSDEMRSKPKYPSSKKEDARVFYVILPGDATIKLLKEADEMGMLQPGWAWILDQLTIEQGGILRDCDFQDISPDLLGLIALKRVYDEGPLYQQTVNKWMSELKKLCGIPQENTVPMSRSLIFTLVGQFGLMYDAMRYSLSLFSKTSNNIEVDDFRTMITNMYHSTEFSLSTNLTFNYDPNHAKKCDYHILNLQSDSWIKSGCWKDTAEGNKDLLRLSLNKATLLFPGLATNTPQNLWERLRGESLKITTIIEPPFVLWQEGELVGLCIDLLEKLAEDLGFKYEIKVVPDNKYGGIDESTGRWNGMINELILQNADLAVAPLTISYERGRAVQFTKPFMEYGATILIKKDVSTGFLFSFLEPFDVKLWLAVVGTIVTSSGFIYLFTMLTDRVERIRNQGSSNNRSVDEEATIVNSLWFIWAAQMDQGAEWIPNALSARVIAGTFWFVAYILSASYTANLTAFLTITRLSGEIRSIEDLRNQDKIRYGTVDGSDLQAFFQSSDIEPYRHMQLVMNERKTAVPNTSVGVQQVRDDTGKFAYLFDKAILDYIAYNEPCDTITVGDTFRKAGYGIAVRPGARYTELLSLEILKLRQDGYIEALRNRWIAGPCVIDPVQTKKSGRLSLQNMTGIFVVFAIGVSLALIVIGISALYAVLKPLKNQQAAIHASPTTNGHHHHHHHHHHQQGSRSADELELETLNSDKLSYSNA